MNKLKKKMKNLEEIFWLNDKVIAGEEMPNCPFSKTDIEEAESLLDRFAPYIMTVFPETKKSKGIIESPLIHVPSLAKNMNLDGELYIKMDADLPISGSVKARGGIYEVLKFAESVALSEGMLSKDEDYSILATPKFKDFFSTYSLAVGSTGNLGLSIGIMGAKLGFNVKVHMSKDARQWKKDLLREKGATVIEYDSNYEMAVSEGRAEAEKDPKCHFVDDENSADLFLGYAVAGKRLSKQLVEKGITVDENHPLCVYIPCGVGGAPGGITFGIKEYIGKDVQIYFAEPTLAPCVTLGLLTGELNKIAVGYIGIRGKTIADGLAVSRPSKLVCEIMQYYLNGCYTVNDDRLLPYVKKVYELENLFLEPSAAAPLIGIPVVDSAMPETTTHIMWATGGSMVPDYERKKYLK